MPVTRLEKQSERPLDALMGRMDGCREAEVPFVPSLIRTRSKKTVIGVQFTEEQSVNSESRVGKMTVAVLVSRQGFK